MAIDVEPPTFAVGGDVPVRLPRFRSDAQLGVQLIDTADSYGPGPGRLGGADQLHVPDPAVRLAESIGALDDLRREGKIRSPC